MHIHLHYHKAYRKALRKLETQAIGQVQQAVMEFEDNPKSPGLNFERLYRCDFCSIRASKELRIILAPLEGEGACPTTTCAKAKVPSAACGSPRSTA